MTIKLCRLVDVSPALHAFREALDNAEMESADHRWSCPLPMIR